MDSENTNNVETTENDIPQGLPEVHRVELPPRPESKVKKILNNWIFHSVIIGVVFLGCVIGLAAAIGIDREKNTPKDNDPRTSAEVLAVREFNASTESGEEAVYDVQIEFTVDDELYTDLYLYNVPKAEPGDHIIIKYNKEDPTICAIAEETIVSYNWGLYIFLICVMAVCVGAVVLEIKWLNTVDHKKRVIASLSDGDEFADNPEEDYNSTEAYGGYDGMGAAPGTGNVFDNRIDYNQMYQYDTSMNDAQYSADSFYSGSGDEVQGESYDPNAFYTASDGESGSAQAELFEPGKEWREKNDANEASKGSSSVPEYDLASLIRSDSETYNGADDSDEAYYPNSTTNKNDGGEEVYYPNRNTQQ